jgi:hypothetical protein
MTVVTAPIAVLGGSRSMPPFTTTTRGYFLQNFESASYFSKHQEKINIKNIIYQGELHCVGGTCQVAARETKV